jgi:hypothetical protein
MASCRSHAAVRLAGRGNYNSLYKKCPQVLPGCGAGFLRGFCLLAAGALRTHRPINLELQQQLGMKFLRGTARGSSGVSRQRVQTHRTPGTGRRRRWRRGARRRRRRRLRDKLRCRHAGCSARSRHPPSDPSPRHRTHRTASAARSRPSPLAPARAPPPALPPALALPPGNPPAPPSPSARCASCGGAPPAAPWRD